VPSARDSGGGCPPGGSVLSRWATGTLETRPWPTGFRPRSSAGRGERIALLGRGVVAVAAPYAELDPVEPAAPGAPGFASSALVADVFARSFGDRPLLCDLIAHTPLNLERNVSPEAVRSYKLTSLGAVDEAAAMVRRVMPDLTPTECGEFVGALASLAGAVWQIANPATGLAELYASDPALSGACVDLKPRLRRTAQILLAAWSPAGPTAPDGGPPAFVGAESQAPISCLTLGAAPGNGDFLSPQRLRRSRRRRRRAARWPGRPCCGRAAARPRSG
jgi:hypothetical protein